MDLLLKIQKWCARTVLSCNKQFQSKSLFISLNLIPLRQMLSYTVVLLYKIKSARCPQYLQEMFASTSKRHNHKTRAGSNDAMLIKRGASTKFNKTFAYYGVKTWNSLPSPLQDSPSLEIAKKS